MQSVRGQGSLEKDTEIFPVGVVAKLGLEG